MLGDGVQEYASHVGVAMLDATICDIYLVNEAGGLVGRPILTACIDAYSGLCCGYTLSWEGGTYSLRGLMLSVIEDKAAYCKQFGMVRSSGIPRIVIVGACGAAITSLRMAARVGRRCCERRPFRPCSSALITSSWAIGNRYLRIVNWDERR